MERAAGNGRYMIFTRRIEEEAASSQCDLDRTDGFHYFPL